jgi:hypothetical protein
VFIHSDLAIEAAKTQAQARTPAVTRFDSELDHVSLDHRSGRKYQPETHLDDSFGSTSSVSLVSACLRQQMLASYVSQYQTMSHSGNITDPRAWLTTLPSIPSPSKALETAAYAVSLARLGATFGAPDMKQESLKLYTQGLRRAQRALEDPNMIYSDETLGACMLLGIYEVFECPGGSRRAYESHHGKYPTRVPFLESY